MGIGDYYLGLDMGTNSVGWAVTDRDYNVPHFRGKPMMGIHLFEEGKTAEERRVARIARRRIVRRRNRVVLLRKLLSEEMEKVDPAFYVRMDESRLLRKDRSIDQPNTLFADAGFDDSEFHKNYPTTYHLRYDLMRTESKPDIRLIYLAAHHIISNRGHFLFDGLGDGDMPEFKTIAELLSESARETLNIDLDLNNTFEEVSNILMDRDLRTTDKKKNLKKLIEDPENKSPSRALAELLAGSKVSLGKLFDDSELKEVKVELGSDIEEVLDKLDDDQAYLIEICKQAYDWGILSSILDGNSCISEYKIKVYEQHGNDLRTLKKAVKKHCSQEIYDNIFRKGDRSSNYCSYVNVYKTEEKAEKSIDGKSGKFDRTQEAFCKFVLKQIGNSMGDDADFKDMLERLKAGTFMPKLRGSSNSIIPNEIHAKELRTILDNVSRFHPFLSVKDEDGISVADKILSLCTFRIPYYVGPLGQDSKNAWAVRRQDGKILPWNFEKMVDLDASAEGFMDNLIGSCTYLPHEKVLPKCSITYSEFMLYNELNNIRINGSRLGELDPSLKEALIRDLFIEGKGRVTSKKIKGVLKKLGLYSEPCEITGFDGYVKSNLDTYVSIKGIIGDRADDKDLAEGIVRILTVFGEDRKRAESRLKTEYGQCLSDEEIASLSKLRFKDWGNLSEKFLCGITSQVSGEYVRDEGEMTILSALKRTDLNLMEILARFSFQKEIDAINSEHEDEDMPLDYDTLVGDTRMSPAVRRSVWRTIRIIKDIVKATGKHPEKIFLETTRGGQIEKKRTASRRDEISNLLKGCTKDVIEWAKENCGLNVSEFADRVSKESDSRLRGKKLYSYYVQLGRCAYCGKKLDLNDLDNKNVCDMDHIYPKSQTFDDSIRNNLVLVCRKCNEDKADTYPISYSIRSKQKEYWSVLLKMGLITKEKFGRLTRSYPLTDDEKGAFISRQLVETSQSVKNIRNVLNRMLPDTDIICVKGRIASDFRNRFSKEEINGKSEIVHPEFIKCREVNDYHHAKDAYLNIVAGNVCDVKYTKDPRNFIKGLKGSDYNLERTYTNDVVDGGNIVWKAGPGGTIETVRKHMVRNDILFTNMTYERNGILFDLMPLRKQNAESKKMQKIPLKKGLSPEKYGGYNSLKRSYFTLVRHNDNGKTVTTLKPIPTIINQHNPDKEDILRFLISEGMEDPEILIDKVRVFTTIELSNEEHGKFYANMAGVTNGRIILENANQLILDYDNHAYYKKIIKYSDSKKKLAEDSNLEPADFDIDYEHNMRLYDALLDKVKGPVFSFFKKQKEQITDGREQFSELCLEKQTEVLNQMMKLFQCNPETCDLREIGGPQYAGKITISPDVSKYDGKVALIFQSPSGLFESRYEIK